MKQLVFLAIALPVLMFNPKGSLAQSTTERDVLTLMLSNESPGYLIDNLIANGYRDSCLYSVLFALQPLSGGVISQTFLDSLSACPANSDVFTAELFNFSALNNPVGIGDDGSVIIAAANGRDYSVMEGYTTYNDTQVPGSLKLFTEANGPEFYINAGTNDDGSTYQAFAIAWSLASTLVLSNEGGLIDDLIRAGHADKNLYQVLEILKPKSGGIISNEFMATLANCPAGSEIFTATLDNVVPPVNNPIGINTDGTLLVVPVYGTNYFQHEGWKNFTYNQSGVGIELYTYSTSPEYYINAGSGGTYYKAFAIAWSNSTDGIPGIETKQETPHVYPNPFCHGLYVMNLNGLARIEVYNMLGELMIQTKTDEDGFISLNKLPDGVYCLKISSDGKVTQQKIIKHR